MSLPSPSERELVETIRRSLEPRIRMRADAWPLGGGQSVASSFSKHPPLPGGQAGELREDIDLLHRNYDLGQMRLHSHRPLVGGLILGVKRLLLRLLTPLLDQQTRFNASATRVIQGLSEQQARLRELEQRFEQRFEQLEKAGAGQETLR